ncbi:Dam family site-specific DNA-(adenine-N6)-methyltransferase [Acinetobacter baumannii]|uniref:Dam family site-specific DNA-(adenine-N6)-methyltransferase n=1 Tax=Acinetobacter baumannii TaxID=470 RepID=UPI000463B754|nr:Dam family site-specific DNA-(adenine-N6)-methyltransferase [Acinetobacter baumannii]MCG9258750.1 Dam family site-specific DNA-(adenine-N6)-methyltransferase [Acinetobacter baumannii]MCG9262447.1 Dam family site-specific DNA-(adenine-N6)-methyltransferase [Acinetobacter baumannii]MDC4286676.1 Dam family site-specific DNA-(adenine-N6)-methyltransferase [Acinetobacter baumannii]MDC4290194.1 Dam family site-specific DNA-(adenine-N6)-methyltransferase [Acinetobacter baumannii]MDC5331557.1 Dam f
MNKPLLVDLNKNSASQKIKCKPILKWAGGKTQMLDSILPRFPDSYGKYIEPFFGGGAVFFALQPENAVIADSNPELINLYRTVADNVEAVINELKKFTNTEEMFYEVRSQDWESLSPEAAAARTIYLNKTCFNGLYRVNKKGQFNVPFGKYKNPKILDEENLRAASSLLSKAKIICCDYSEVLEKFTFSNDLIFLDPPYVPISEYSDFKRYTKEQFYLEDHEQLAKIYRALSDKGCHVFLTNSNHPVVQSLYSGFQYEVIQTKRHISCDSKTRKGEDVIISTISKNQIFHLDLERVSSIPEQVKLYPSTRYMGSKQKLLPYILGLVEQFNVPTLVDLFSGSGIVSYLFKTLGKQVITNDYMNMSHTFTKAMVENNHVILSDEKARSLLIEKYPIDDFVQKKFKDLYFSDNENLLIDIIRSNILKLDNEYEQAIARSALIRACMKKRPRGIFTYTGHRYDDGRKDLVLTLEEQFLNAIEAINQSIFDNHQLNISYRKNALDVELPDNCLIYMDPPYYSTCSDNEYVRRYHFVEGLSLDWKEIEIQEHTKTKKFKSYPTPFSSRKDVYVAFEKLFEKYKENILLISYSSNSLPNMDEMLIMLRKYKENVDVIPIDYKYSFGNQATKVGDNRNTVQEYLFVAY